MGNGRMRGKEMKRRRGQIEKHIYLVFGTLLTNSAQHEGQFGADKGNTPYEGHWHERKGMLVCVCLEKPNEIIPPQSKSSQTLNMTPQILSVLA